MLEKVIEICLLFDFYGSLLTEKQQQAILLHYYDDLSLSEIAEKMAISRQGVYDHLQRGEELLRGYETKLKHVARYGKMREKLEELSENISQQSEINSRVKEELLGQIEGIKRKL